MNKRFEWHSYYKRMVLDTETNKIIKVIDTLNRQQQRISELEEQLSRAIVPKFKIGQEVWYISDTNKVFNFTIDNIGGLYFRYYDDNGFWLHEEDLFATKEEAELKLKELQGEQL